ncbi:hypothetical protein BDP27DRAFT_1358337 [Rhodocollybia butyracea]|uniref:Uncharacterized protein n=1 Tax=Rhodocollybia butyracea TaxID=206335 RepID=A0A9P5UEV3_9AGAR|nr:hypothetical protein BDP27DRAFT_1358337 [Rhodocollybia butyracea]
MDLPPNPYGDFSDLYKAYNSCLDLQRRESWDVDEEEKSFANDINTCNSLGELASLAHLVLEGIIRIYPVAVELQKHYSHPSFTPQTEHIVKEPEEEIKVQRRNYYRCIVSQDVSIQAENAGSTKANENDKIAYTKVVHILKQSTSEDTGDPENRTMNDAGTIENLFDELSVALSHVPDAEQPNTYEVHTFPPNLHTRYCVPTKITLTDHLHGEVLMPNPRYFELHCICAKVIQLSGVAKLIDKLSEDLEDTDVLAVDGSSATQLSFVLSTALRREVASVH